MAKKKGEGASQERGLTRDEAEVVEERRRLRSPVIYEIVREEGEEEMRRPLNSLWWSGIAAGLSIGFSLMAEAVLQKNLPDTSWRPLVVDMGYTVGFIMVILGRQQLFTENTVTPILPLAANPNARDFRRVARLWAVVFAANMVGTFGFALFNTLLPDAVPGLLPTMLEISAEALARDWVTMFVSAIGAGFLIATVVWLIPSAEGTKLHVIFIMTYLIAIGGFSHIVAGSTEGFLLVLNGETSIFAMIWGFTIPVLLGNIVGGVGLFALVAYGQVMQELDG